MGKTQVGSHIGNLQNTLIKAGFFTLDSNWFTLEESSAS